MSTARSQITDSLITKLKLIDGTGVYKTKIYGNVFKGINFWDSINDYPSVYVAPGTELREYHPGDFKWTFLTITIRIFVHEDDPQTRLEEIISDVETVIDANNDLQFNETDETVDIRIVSIDTDEGLLSPYGAGEVKLFIRYETPNPI